MLKLDKNWKIIFKKEYLLWLIVLIIFLVISNFVGSIRDEKNLKLCEIQKTESLVNNLKKDSSKIKFIANHLFTGNQLDYREFLKNIAFQNKAKIISIEEKDTKSIGCINKKTVSMTGIFWHDKFVFDFLNDVQNFHPGFARVVSIDIDKFAKISLSKPVIKVEILCEVFQKS